MLLGIQLSFELFVGHPLPAFVDFDLAPAVELVDDVAVHSVTLFAALRVVLPGAEDGAEAIVVASFLVELVEAALLRIVFLVKFADSCLLLVNALHHLRNFAISAARVLVEVLLILVHVARANLSVCLH